MHGIINVLKHSGVSSHDIVNKLRKILKTKKVGHTGTLDPDAIGVLPICIGNATRLAEFISANTKTYRAIIKFGFETDTQDSSGQIINRAEIPELNKEEINEVLQTFVGEIEQVPPMYSAIKIDGTPLYKLARKGIEIERKARKIIIYDIKLINYFHDSALIEVNCGKGTYIRTLCNDIGRAVNSAAYMGFLLRVQSGIFHINDAFTVEEISTKNPEEILISPAQGLYDWKQIVLEDKNLIWRIQNGNILKEEYLNNQKLIENENYKVINTDGDLLAIGKVNYNYFKPEKVFR